jgi:hypothetical protein
MATLNIRNPKHGWLVWLLLLPTFLVAAVFGFFVLLAILGAVLIGALVFGLRLWWLRRKLARAAHSQVLEAEYVVVRESRPDDRRLR